jgi:hypothetical protein
MGLWAMKEPCEKAIAMDTLSGPERFKRKHWRMGGNWRDVSGCGAKNLGILGFQQDLGSFSI